MNFCKKIKLLCSLRIYFYLRYGRKISKNARVDSDEHFVLYSILNPKRHTTWGSFYLLCSKAWLHVNFYENVPVIWWHLFQCVHSGFANAVLSWLPLLRTNLDINTILSIVLISLCVSHSSLSFYRCDIWLPGHFSEEFPHIRWGGELDVMEREVAVMCLIHMIHTFPTC